MPRTAAKKNQGRTTPFSKTILGEAASKANSRRIVVQGGKVRSIKSDKALSFVRAFQFQCPMLDPMFEDDVCVTMKIYYASRRPDLDESVVLDAMQGFIYRNDRQVREKHILWALDADNPRVEFLVEHRP